MLAMQLFECLIYVQFTSFLQKVNFNTFTKIIECVYLLLLIYIYLLLKCRDAFRTLSNIESGAIFVKKLKGIQLLTFCEKSHLRCLTSFKIRPYNVFIVHWVLVGGLIRSCQKLVKNSVSLAHLKSMFLFNTPLKTYYFLMFSGGR